MRILRWLLVVALAILLSEGASAQTQAFTVPLHETNESGVTGTAIFTPNDNGTTTVRVQLRGDRVGKVHPVHLHEGVCSGTVPTIRYPLKNLANGTSTTRVRAELSNLLTEELYINVHQSPQVLKNVIVCGSVTAPDKLPSTGEGGLSQTGSAALPLGIILAMGLAAGSLRRLRPAQPHVSQ